MLKKVIAEAKVALTKNPFDVLHGVEHHHKVWENCVWIVEEEDLKINSEVLQIAAWWHDYEKHKQDHQLLLSVLNRYGYPDSQIEKIIRVIDEHSFRNLEQTSKESEILFDADKLEYLSVPRWKVALEAVKEGKFVTEKMDEAVTVFNERIYQVSGRLHFDSTRDRFARDWQKFSSWALPQGFIKSAHL